MKTLTGNAATELAKNTGTEPVLLLEIQWSGTSVSYYGDKDIFGYPGKLLSVDNIESLVVGNDANQTVSVKIDDTDGSIKAIINVRNVHTIKAILYQVYPNLTLADKIQICEGLIETPFTWSEVDRTVTFNIQTQIESFEVGFSPEEGQLPFVSKQFIGKPWPLCFGSVFHVPAQKVHQILTGKIRESIGIVDPTLAWKLERLSAQWAIQATMLTWWKLALSGLDAIAPPVQTILDQYVAAILAEDQQNIVINQVTHQIEIESKKVQEDPLDRAAVARLRNWETVLYNNAQTSHIIQTQKKILEDHVPLARFEHETKLKVAENIINAWNGMQSIYDEYVAVQDEICRQQKLVKSQVSVINGEQFTQGTPIEVIIKNVRYRGTFAGELFVFEAGPMAKHGAIPVGPWVIDTDSCAPTDESNGLSVFYLRDNPPISLVGLYLLVKKRGTDDSDGTLDRHVIKVIRQNGKKVVYQLVGWKRSSGKPISLSIDDMVNRITAFAKGGGFKLPINSNNLSGSLDPALFNLPQTKHLLSILDMIPNGVNKEELEKLTVLSFLLPWESVTTKSLVIGEPTARQVYTIIGEDVEEIIEASGVIHASWLETYTIPEEEIPENLDWVANAGSNFKENTNDCEVFVANILPSIIKSVSAYRTNEDGYRYLAEIPSSYYSKYEAANLGTINVTALIFKTPITDIEGEEWEEEVYVTLESSVGPNVADIIQHLLLTYTTGGSLDATNLTAMQTVLDKYPANFALFDRPNVLKEIERIAWESRCAIYRNGTKYFIKYLAQEPTTDRTFTLADIHTETLSVQYSSTEQITTRLIVTYDQNYLEIGPANPKRPDLVYRHNVKLYGLHTENEHFHIYNEESLVQKSATFWLIRKANIWKILSIKTMLRNLVLDPFDTINFNLGKTFFSNSAVKGVIQVINYDTGDNILDVVCLLPIRSGEMDVYEWFWPADRAAGANFPTSADIALGYAGGYGPGSGVTGVIGDCQ